jgi:peroxiredoxin
VPEGKGGKGPLASVASVAAALVAAVLVVVAFLYARAPRTTRLHVGDTAPDFALPQVDATGATVRLSHVRGGSTFLFFFDTHRDGNESYLESLQRMQKHYADRGLITIAVALDPRIGTVRQTLDRVYVEFPVLSDPLAAVVHTSYGAVRDPEAYLLDGQGRVAAVFTERVDWKTSEFREQLEKVLRPASPGS